MVARSSQLLKCPIYVWEKSASTTFSLRREFRSHSFKWSSEVELLQKLRFSTNECSWSNLSWLGMGRAGLVLEQLNAGTGRALTDTKF